MESCLLVLDKIRITKNSFDYINITILYSEITIINSKIIREFIINMIDKGYTNITLNLSNVKMIDASGLGMLISIYNRLKSMGNIRLTDVSPHVGRILKITKLDKIFHILGVNPHSLKNGHIS